MNNKEPGMTLIVKTITRITFGLILAYGIYIVLRGHISPGGGFAGGVIIALSFIHLLLAFGREAVLKKINQARGILLMCIGGLAFLFIGALNFLSRQHLSGYKGHFKLSGGGLIPFADMAIALMVSAGLFVIFLALVSFRGNKEQ